MKKKIAVLSGDGIGPEVIKQSLKVLNAIEKKFNHQFEYTYGDIGAVAIDNTGESLPKDTINICNDADAILFGAIGDPKYDNNPNAKVRPEQGLLALRKKMGLFANIRPVSAYDTLLHKSPLKKEIIKGVDFVVYRELTGGIYFGEKGRNDEGDVAFDQCIYSKKEVERIARLAFEAALVRKKKVTLVDKANVLETSRLWRETVLEISKEYSEIELEMMFVDNAAMQIIQYPKSFDVVLTENMFGDIISDAASVIPGSLGMLPSASVGEKTALFEPIHGSYPQAKGLNIANPLATILSVSMMLDHFGLNNEALIVKEAVNVSLQTNVVTPDIDGASKITTEKVGDYLAELINEELIDGEIKQENISLGLSTII